MDRQNRQPLYASIAQKLREEIEVQKYHTGSLLPSERELCEMNQVSRKTVRRALDDLAAGGWIHKVPGLGAYVGNPNEVAAQTKRQLTGNIAFIMWGYPQATLKGPIVSRILYGMEESAEKLGIELVFRVGSDIQMEELIRTLRKDRKVEGLLLEGNIDLDTISSFEKEFLVIVVNNFFVEDKAGFKFNFNAVLPDYLNGAREAVNYLIGQGHRKCGFISWSLRHYGYSQRLDGYRLALAEAGIDLNSDWIQIGEGDENACGYLSMKKLLALPEPPTAVFCATDSFVTNAQNAIKEAGLKVPDDISLIGFDNVESANSKHPFISTVDVPWEDVGAVAVSRLSALLRFQRKSHTTTLIQPRLLIRESCRDIS